MSNVKFFLAAALAVGAAGLTQSASAMPRDGFDPAFAEIQRDGARIEPARWMCGPYGCRWAPNHRPPAYGYGPRWGHQPYGRHESRWEHAPRRHWREW